MRFDWKPESKERYFRSLFCEYYDTCRQEDKGK